MSQLQRAFNCKRNLGGTAAKVYMVKRGWPWYAKLYVMIMS